MPVLVTGASGFLGGRLAQMLADCGASVRILARPASDLRHLANSRFEVARGDLSDVELLRLALRDVTHVYHCAGCSTDWARWKVYYQSNVEGVRNLIRAALETPRLERFLHVSSTDIYGYPADPCDESHQPTDVGLPYNRSKCMGEAAVWASGLPVTVVRPATIYGPRSKAFVADIARLIRRGSMAVIDGGRVPGGFCYVDNAAHAILEAARSRETLGRAYNLADGTGVTWRSYVDALADGLGERRPWLDIPSALALPLARMLEWVAPTRPVLTRHAVYLLSRNQEYPTGRAKRDFGFAPAVLFEEGIARTIRWLRKELTRQ
jgi:nucleoside-diphosphate-sugar epimerase